MKEATRVSPTNKKSGLDHIYTNKPSKVTQAAVETNGSSDYKLVKVTRFTKAEVKTQNFVTKRCFKIFEKDAFLADVRCRNVYQDINYIELIMVL